MEHFAREIVPGDPAWRIQGQCYFHSKVAVDTETCVFAAYVFGGEHDFYDPGDPYSLFYTFKRGEWRCIELSARITSIARYRADGWRKSGVAILSEAGEIWMLGDDAEQIRVDVPDASLLSGVHVLDGRLFVTGYGGQLYRQTETGWVHDDPGILGAEPPIPRPRDGDHGHGDFSCSLLAQTPVHGDLYAAGMAYIARPCLYWRPKGQDWQWLDLTSRYPQLDQAGLTGIFAANSEDVWISTDKGVLLRGNGHTGFKIAFEGVRSADQKLTSFTQALLFEEQLYFGGSSVCRLSSDGTLERMAPAPQTGRDTGARTQIAGTIDTADGILWAIGDGILWRFDGHDWERIVMPSVEPI